MSGGVACYIKSNICYSRKTCLSDNLENIFIDLLFPKTKPISVGIFYKPPGETWSLEQIITEFESLERNNELYTLGHFNINLLFKGNCIVNKTHEIKNHFKDFCTSRAFAPSRLTCLCALRAFAPYVPWSLCAFITRLARLICTLYSRAFKWDKVYYYC